MYVLALAACISLLVLKYSFFCQLISLWEWLEVGLAGCGSGSLHLSAIVYVHKRPLLFVVSHNYSSWSPG